MQSEMLILHGKQAGNDEVREAVMKRREAGHDIAVRVTWEKDDAARYVREARENSCETVIAGGGDGSVRDVVDALMQAGANDNPRLAVLPLGTANDFATAAGIPEAPDEALALLDGTPRAIDVIRVNDRHFINMATGGFGTEVTSQTSEDLKSLLGGAAYLLTGLTRFAEIRSATGRFSGPDFDWEGEFLALGLGNGRQAGGGQRLCPDALINDGLLDVAILPAEMDMFAGVRKLFGSETQQDALFVRGQVSKLIIETPESMNLNLDGEPLESHRFELTVLPGGLELYLPEDSSLLSLGSE